MIVSRHMERRSCRWSMLSVLPNRSAFGQDEEECSQGNGHDDRSRRPDEAQKSAVLAEAREECQDGDADHSARGEEEELVDGEGL